MAKTDAIRVPIEVEWRNDEAYRRGYEAGREAQAIPQIDVDLLARATAIWSDPDADPSEIDRDAAFYVTSSQELVAIYARLASESSTACDDCVRLGVPCGQHTQFRAALPVKEWEPE